MNKILRYPRQAHGQKQLSTVRVIHNTNTHMRGAGKSLMPTAPCIFWLNAASYTQRAEWQRSKSMDRGMMSKLIRRTTADPKLAMGSRSAGRGLLTAASAMRQGTSAGECFRFSRGDSSRCSCHQSRFEFCVCVVLFFLAKISEFSFPFRKQHFDERKGFLDCSQVWCWTSALSMIATEVAQTPALMTPYITLLMLIGHLMKLSMTKLENIDLIIITDPLRPSPLCQL